MKKRQFLFLLLLIVISAVKITGQNIPIPIGQWRTHLPYFKANLVCIGEDEIYCATEFAVFSYGLSDNIIQKYDKVSGLTGTDISALGYNTSTGQLLIGYQSGNIDLLENGLITNIPDIVNTSFFGIKRINQLFFDDELAYLACSFGIAVLDLKNDEFKDTYFFYDSLGLALSVNAITITGSSMFAATDIGIWATLLSNPSIRNQQTWTYMNNTYGLPEQQASDIFTLGTNLYTTIKDTIFQYTGSVWNSWYTSDSGWQIRDAEKGNESAIVLLYKNDSNNNLADRAVLMIDTFGTVTQLNISGLGNPMMAIQKESDSTLWMADQWIGLIEVKNQEVISHTPNGPTSTNVRSLAIHNNNVWVAPGGVNSSWNSLLNGDGFFNMSDYGYWSTFDGYGFPALDSIKDIMTIVVNPSDGHVFIGSYGGGVMEYYEKQLKVYKQNSSLQPITGDPGSYRVAGLAFDLDGNLWVGNYGAPKPISVKTPMGDWKAFDVPYTWLENSVGQIIVDDYTQKWIILAKREGLLVFDHGTDIINTNDDQFRRLGVGIGNGGLPVLNVNCIAKDLDGEIWVGTDEGVAVFYCPGQVLTESGCDAQQILVEQDGFAGYLLETEAVKTIAIDGANRKWIGTNNGVWLLSPDGTEQINYFNTENSPLLSNAITDIAVNGLTGEVFIGTEEGLISYRGTATEGGITHSNVLVFPNPVREDYNGTIAVKGLVRDADVKITDVSGTLIYQTQALGGQAIWDGKNYNNIKAKSGVYLVFSTDDSGRETEVARFLIIN